MKVKSLNEPSPIHAEELLLPEKCEAKALFQQMHIPTGAMNPKDVKTTKLGIEFQHLLVPVFNNPIQPCAW